MDVSDFGFYLFVLERAVLHVETCQPRLLISWFCRSGVTGEAEHITPKIVVSHR